MTDYMCTVKTPKTQPIEQLVQGVTQLILNKRKLGDVSAVFEAPCQKHQEANRRMFLFRITPDGETLLKEGGNHREPNSAVESVEITCKS